MRFEDDFRFGTTTELSIYSGGSRICEKGGPEIQIPPGKSRSAGGGGGGGGTPTHFFPDFIYIYFFLRHLHFWVGVPSAYQTDLQGDKQKKQKKTAEKKKNRPKKGGPRPIRPPPGSATDLSIKLPFTHYTFIFFFSFFFMCAQVLSKSFWNTLLKFTSSNIRKQNSIYLLLQNNRYCTFLTILVNVL